MPTTIDSAGITFNDATSLTSAVIPANAVGATQIANGSVTAAKLGTTEQKQICKAWVNFNGTTSPGTIRSSYNVSSVTKSATGRWTVNFSTPMANANYSAVASGSRDASGSQVGVFVLNFLAGSFDINELAGATFFDIPIVTASVFAD
jgi:hypothetical protein